MSNEKAWARAQRAARASYMDPPKKQKNIRIRQHNKTCQNTDVNRTKSTLQSRLYQSLLEFIDISKGHLADTLLHDSQTT